MFRKYIVTGLVCVLFLLCNSREAKALSAEIFDESSGRFLMYSWGDTVSPVGTNTAFSSSAKINTMDILKSNAYEATSFSQSSADLISPSPDSIIKQNEPVTFIWKGPSSGKSVTLTLTLDDLNYPYFERTYSNVTTGSDSIIITSKAAIIKATLTTTFTSNEETREYLFIGENSGISTQYSQGSCPGNGYLDTSLPQSTCIYSGSCNDIFKSIYQYEHPFKGAFPFTPTLSVGWGYGVICYAGSRSVSCSGGIKTWCGKYPKAANMLLKHELHHVLTGVKFFKNTKLSEFAAESNANNGGRYKFRISGSTKWYFATELVPMISQKYLIPKGLNESDLRSFLNGNKDSQKKLESKGIYLNSIITSYRFGTYINGRPPGLEI